MQPVSNGMISTISGKIKYCKDKFLILETAGIGFKIFASSDTLFNLSDKIEKDVMLWTYLSVKEDALDLYGFKEISDLEFFEKIISVSGIGPKKGISIMSVAPTETLKKAIATKDLSYLTQVSGIGRKNAEKIVLELKDKMGELKDGGDALNIKDESDVLMAIKSLGYGAQEAREVIKNIPREVKGVSEKVKWALKELGR